MTKINNNYLIVKDLTDNLDLEIKELLEIEIEGLKEKLDSLEVELLLNGPYDNGDAIIEIHSGAGGTEAQDWADMLLRMYMRWAQLKGYNVELLDKSEGDEAGIERILAAMGCKDHPGVRVLRYDGTNAREMTEAIAGSGSVIATRFHAAILALAAGRPVLPVLYSDKTLHVLQDLAFAGMMPDLRDGTDWDVAACRRSLEQQKPMPAETISAAQGHFSKLDRLLR